MPQESKSNQARDWKAVNKSCGFGIPEEEVDRVGIALDELLANCQRSTGMDLSLVEPIGTFDPAEE